MKVETTFKFISVELSAPFIDLLSLSILCQKVVQEIYIMNGFKIVHSARRPLYTSSCGKGLVKAKRMVFYIMNGFKIIHTARMCTSSCGTKRMVIMQSRM